MSEDCRGEHGIPWRGAPKGCIPVVYSRGVGSPPMMAQDPRGEWLARDELLEWLRGLKRQGRTLADAIQELINDMVP